MSAHIPATDMLSLLSDTASLKQKAAPSRKEQQLRTTLLLEYPSSWLGSDASCWYLFWTK